MEKFNGGQKELISCSYELNEKLKECKAKLVDSLHECEEKLIQVLIELASKSIVIENDEDQNSSNGERVTL